MPKLMNDVIHQERDTGDFRKDTGGLSFGCFEFEGLVGL